MVTFEQGKYTWSILPTPVAQRRASKVGLCPTSACSFLLGKRTVHDADSDRSIDNLLLQNRNRARLDWVIRWRVSNVTKTDKLGHTLVVSAKRFDPRIFHQLSSADLKLGLSIILAIKENGHEKGKVGGKKSVVDRRPF